MYILPRYSPIIPSINIINPPMKSRMETIELQPKAILAVNFLIIVTTPKTNPTNALSAPIKEDILNGLTEKAVNPLIHILSILKKVNVLLPSNLSLCLSSTLTISVVVLNNNPVKYGYGLSYLIISLITYDLQTIKLVTCISFGLLIMKRVILSLTNVPKFLKSDCFLFL